MSQTQAVALPTRSRIHWLVPLILISVALALVALGLVQHGGGDAVSPATVSKNAPAAPATARPDESKIAAAIAAGVTPINAGPAAPAERPDESKVAAAIAGGR